MRQRVPAAAWRAPSKIDGERHQDLKNWVPPESSERCVLKRDLGCVSPLELRRRVFGWRMVANEMSEELPLETSTLMTCCDIDSTDRWALCGGADGCAHVFDLEGGGPSRKTGRCSAESRYICAASWHDVGLFATTTIDGKVTVWDASRLEEAVTWKVSQANGADVGGGHCRVAVACRDGSVRLCDPLSTRVSPLEVCASSSPATAVAWSRHSTHSVCVGRLDGSVQIYDVRSTSRPVATLDKHGDQTRVGRAHEREVVGVQFASCFVVTASRDGNLGLWDAISGSRIPTHLPKFPSLSRLSMASPNPLAPSEACVFVPVGDAVRVVDLNSGKDAQATPSIDGIVKACSLRPSKTQIFVVSDTDTVSLFQAPRTKLSSLLATPEDDPYSASLLTGPEEEIIELRRAVARARREDRERRLRDDEDDDNDQERPISRSRRRRTGASS